MADSEAPIVNPGSCPDPDELTAFHHGQLPEARIDQITEHLASCPSCEAALSRLDQADDSLALGLRRVEQEATADRRFDPSAQLGAGSIIGGRYKLIECIGSGGMGQVWMAQQMQPVRRLVAVKLIKEGMNTRQVLARFEAERQALALMDHPNIAKVLDAGASFDGRPYFVMELVRGSPITTYCDTMKTPIRDRLELFISACRAIQHAHQKGIIHRDIKPGNVLVAAYDSRPVVKVIDFGVVKAIGQPLTERTLVTHFGALVGTPEYMSPEQAELNQLDIDTRSDVYALGVLLYELLTGSTPLTRQRLGQAALLEVLRLVREEDPHRPSVRLSTTEGLPTIAANRGLEPSRLSSLIRGDLDWIVMKALEKDRSRRYETAVGLAREVERFLADEPVEAARPSTRRRVLRFARRHRWGLIVAALVTSLLVGSAIGGTALAIRAARGERKAIQESSDREALQQFFLDKVFAAGRPEGQGGGLGKDVTLRQAIDEAASAVAEAFAGRPLVEAAVRRTLGITYSDLGDPKAALDQMRRAHKLFQKELGSDHHETLQSLDSLAAATSYAGYPEDAIPLRTEAFERRKALLGPDHPETLASRIALFMAGPKPSIEEFERVVAQLRGQVEPDHPLAIKALNAIAGVYWEAGRWPEALARAADALNCARTRYGPHHPDSLRVLGLLASYQERAGKTDDAIKLMEEALVPMRTKLGDDHPITLWTLQYLGRAYRASGKPDIAIPLFEQAAEGLKNRLGAHHQNAIRCLFDLGVAYNHAGRFEDAAKVEEKATQEARKTFGLDAFFTVKMTIGWAENLILAGHVPEGQAVFNEFLAGRRERVKADTTTFAHDLAWVGWTLMRQGQAAAAEPLLVESLAIRKRKYPDSWKTFNAQSLLGGSLALQGEGEKAEPLLLAGYAGMRVRESTISADGKANLPEAVDRLIQFYEAEKRSEEATKWRIERKKYPAKPGSPRGW